MPTETAEARVVPPGREVPGTGGAGRPQPDVREPAARYEIGIRCALAADARRVLLLVLGQGMTLALVGTLLGIGVSAIAVRAVRPLVFGVSVYDPWNFAAVAVLLIAVAAMSSWLPARRASRVDPVIALRSGRRRDSGAPPSGPPAPPRAPAPTQLPTRLVWRSASSGRLEIRCDG